MAIYDSEYEAFVRRNPSNTGYQYDQSKKLEGESDWAAYQRQGMQHAQYSSPSMSTYSFNSGAVNPSGWWNAFMPQAYPGGYAPIAQQTAPAISGYGAGYGQSALSNLASLAGGGARDMVMQRGQEMQDQTRKALETRANAGPYNPAAQRQASYQSGALEQNMAGQLQSQANQAEQSALQNYATAAAGQRAQDMGAYQAQQSVAQQRNALMQNYMGLGMDAQNAQRQADLYMQRLGAQMQANQGQRTLGWEQMLYGESLKPSEGEQAAMNVVGSLGNILTGGITAAFI